MAGVFYPAFLTTHRKKGISYKIGAENLTILAGDIYAVVFPKIIVPNPGGIRHQQIYLPLVVPDFLPYRKIMLVIQRL